MQLSVIPHLTIYGDVKPSDVKKKSYVMEKLGALGGRDVEKERLKQLLGKEENALSSELKYDITKPAEPRADLMKASG